jgi:hypothetical protein
MRSSISSGPASVIFVTPIEAELLVKAGERVRHASGFSELQLPILREERVRAQSERRAWRVGAMP